MGREGDPAPVPWGAADSVSDTAKQGFGSAEHRFHDTFQDGFRAQLMIDARRERKITTTEHDRQDAHEQHVQRPRFATNTAHDTHEEVRAKL